MGFTIRQAHIHDADAIALVHVESWRSAYKGIVPDAFLAALDVKERTRQWGEWFVADAYEIVVAEGHSGIVGFAAGGKSREETHDYDAELYAIYLLQPQQRQGVGRMLTHALAKNLSAAGLNSMLVWVLEQNPAVSFYKHLGAVQIARKSIEIGGTDLSELAFGWASISRLAEITEAGYRHERID